MTDPQRELRVLEILSDALSLSGDALDKFLDKTCAGDQELRAELDELLAESNAESEDFLATTPFGDPLDQRPDVRR